MTVQGIDPLVIEQMVSGDILAVQAIERASFTTPWPPQAYRQELETNRLATYLVVRLAGELVAYGGVWLMVDEAHITTFAVHPRRRRRGIGERLLLALLDVARDGRAREATLEVRLSNLAARRLYEKYGFRPVGIRPRYYSDDGEDALIMTTDPLDSPAMQERLAGLRAALAAAGPPVGGAPPTEEPPVGAPPVPDAAGQALAPSGTPPGPGFPRPAPAAPPATPPWAGRPAPRPTEPRDAFGSAGEAGRAGDAP